MGLLEISLLTFVISAIISYYIWTRDKKWFKDFNGPNPVVPIFGNMYRFGGKEAGKLQQEKCNVRNNHIYNI